MNRKGRCIKDSFSVGEIVRVQNIQSKLWDTQAVITGTRVVADGRIVSYDLDINGNHSTRHRKFLQKCHLPNRADDLVVENSVDESGLSKVSEVEDIHVADRRVLQREQARGQARPGQDRRSPRLQNRTWQGAGM